MKKSETAKILSLIIAACPDSKAKPDRETVEIWHLLLCDLDFELVVAATKKVLQEQEYPTIPAIGKIRKAAIFLANPRRLSAPEAWQQVLFAIRRFGYMQEKEAKESMQALVAKAVDCVGWRDICLSENVDTIRAQFRMAYNALEKRESEILLMSPELKELNMKAVKALEMGQ